MQRMRVSAYVPKATAAMMAAVLVGTSLVPLAQAQEATKESKAAEASSEAQKPPAPPKPPDQKTRWQARDAFTKGEKAFKKEKYWEAFENFKTANDLIPSPHAEYWMARSLDV